MSSALITGTSVTRVSSPLIRIRGGDPTFKWRSEPSAADRRRSSESTSDLSIPTASRNSPKVAIHDGKPSNGFSSGASGALSCGKANDRVVVRPQAVDRACGQGVGRQWSRRPTAKHTVAHLSSICTPTPSIRCSTGRRGSAIWLLPRWPMASRPWRSPITETCTASSTFTRSAGSAPSRRSSARRPTWQRSPVTSARCGVAASTTLAARGSEARSSTTT